ncbi:MAG: hypothetical protein ACI8R4_003362 [Paracoccaceae bacterium]|jgi:hypothetical protein
MMKNTHPTKRLLVMTAPVSRQSAKPVSLMFGDGTPRKAIITALVVGTALTAINHGDAILSGQYPPLIKVLLTFCVPYCVTTWGAVTGKLSQAKHLHPGIAQQKT